MQRPSILPLLPTLHVLNYVVLQRIAKKNVPEIWEEKGNPNSF